MPIKLDIATLVLTKNLVGKQYKGGVKKFKEDFNFDIVEAFEEDNELLALSQMDFRDIDVDRMVQNGIPKEQFEKTNLERETAFCSKYGGAFDKPHCFDYNALFIWHKECSHKSITKATYLGNSTINELTEMFEQGINPFHTFQ